MVLISFESRNDTETKYIIIMYCNQFSSFKIFCCWKWTSTMLYSPPSKYVRQEKIIIISLHCLCSFFKLSFIPLYNSCIYKKNIFYINDKEISIAFYFNGNCTDLIWILSGSEKIIILLSHKDYWQCHIM